jgi:pimeloyl-ACP methyl ester carboxylesterase
MHGFKGFKDWGMFPPVADRLARAGFTAVSFNVSGSGVDHTGEFTFPERFSRNTYTAELADVKQVLEAVADGAALGLPPPSSTGLLGHSRGGGMAILETARNPNVRALVTWAAIGSVDRWSAEAKAAWRRRGFVNIQNARTGQIIPLGTEVLDDTDRHATATLDIMAASRTIAIPWMIAHGAEDETVPVDDAEQLHEANGPRARLLIVPGAGHTFGAVHPLKEIPASLEQVMNETTAWFSRHLT